MHTYSEMKLFIKKIISLLPLIIIVFFGRVSAQQGALKEEKNPFHKAYHDSLRTMNYDATFPLLGKKAYKKGYDIQFPWGVGLAYFVQQQKVLIKSTKISF